MPAPLPPPDPLADSLIILRTSHRFRADSGIGALARAVNSGDPCRLASLLARSWPDVQLVDPATEPPEWLRLTLAQWFEPLFAAASPEEALAHLGACRVLCALREGPRGVSGINQLAEAALRRRAGLRPGERIAATLPILIERNDYELKLYNGDTGILWPDQHGRPAAWFPREGEGPRSIPLARLPAWDISFALTVHKSQGSEFTRVLLALPDDDSPLLSRELLYTGITRAKSHLTVFARMDLLGGAIRRRVMRHSGLREQLRG